MLAALDPPHDQLVTSSDLVRHFGRWQDRAARDPVYILHRGRPRFVLTSVDVMEALCAPHANGDGADRQLLSTLLDGMSELAIVADDEGRVTAASRTARGYFGTLVDPGAAIGGIVGAAARPILAGAVARVVGSGIPDRIEIPSLARPGRELSLAIVPCPGGVVLFGSDASVEAELCDARADAASLGEAIGVDPGAAVARINLRGYIATPGADLAALTGLAADALASVRFVTLLDIAGRVAVADAIEAVIADGVARGIAATLLVNRAAPRPLRIGLAAWRRSLAVEGVTALLVAAPAG